MDERLRSLQDLDAEDLEAIYQSGHLPDRPPRPSVAEAASLTSGFGDVDVVPGATPQDVVTLRVPTPA